MPTPTFLVIAPTPRWAAWLDRRLPGAISVLWRIRAEDFAATDIATSLGVLLLLDEKIGSMQQLVTLRRLTPAVPVVCVIPGLASAARRRLEAHWRSQTTSVPGEVGTTAAAPPAMTGATPEWDWACRELGADAVWCEDDPRSALEEIFEHVVARAAR